MILKVLSLLATAYLLYKFWSAIVSMPDLLDRIAQALEKDPPQE